MQLGVITQIRNEIDIINTFLSHIDNLFDFVYLVDHQSIDGTEKILKDAVSSRPKWKYFFLDVKTRLQSSVTNLLLNQAFSDGIDYLFFLDADEFIEIESRFELEIKVQNLNQMFSVGLLSWKNCICNDFHEISFSQFSKIWIPSETSNFNKIIISKYLYEKCEKRLTVSQGHHGAYDSNGIGIPGIPIGTLLHIPIRGLQQTQKKVILTVISYRGFSYRKPGNSYQYYEMLKKIADGKVTDNDIRGFTIGFDKPCRENSEVFQDELIKYGYDLQSLKELGVILNDGFIIRAENPEIPFAKLVASTLNKLEDHLPSDVPLFLENNIIRIDKEALKLICQNGDDIDKEKLICLLKKDIQDNQDLIQSLQSRILEQEKKISLLMSQIEVLDKNIRSRAIENVIYPRTIRNLLRKFFGLKK